MAELLDAAAQVIAVAGFEAATMSEVAERAGASIGSLYQFFPNKESITEALCGKQAREIEARWLMIETQARKLDLRGMTDRLIEVTIEFANRHPAFLALLDAPCARRNSSAVRQRFRQLLAEFLLVRKPRMSQAKANRLATVTLQLMKALLVLYKEAKRTERPLIVREFKMVLFSYLTARMGTLPTPAGRVPA